MFLTVCRLTLHDYLFYASREMGRLYETEKYLHNYGLTYALGLAKSPHTNTAQVPHYAEDLSPLNEQGVYVTPAHPVQCSFAFHTFKMANVNYYAYTPQESRNRVVFGRAKELAPESSFEFFVLSRSSITLPHWIRLGKWMAKARVTIQNQIPVQVRQGNGRMWHVTGPLNPLDLVQHPASCNIVAMAPASLITNVSLDGDYYEGAGVMLPAGMSYQPIRGV